MRERTAFLALLVVPGLPALGVLLAVGLESLPGRRQRREVAAVLAAGGLAVVNGGILVGIVVPAYYPPVTPFLSTQTVELREPTTRGLAPDGHGACALSAIVLRSAIRLTFQCEILAFCSLR